MVRVEVSLDFLRRGRVNVEVCFSSGSLVNVKDEERDRIRVDFDEEV